MYFRNLDFFRFYSCLAVILFHIDFTALGFSSSPFEGGYLGVDFFFVLSGFVITWTVYNKLEKNMFKGFTFLLRRLGRLMPAIIILNIVLFFLTFSSNPSLWYSGAFFSVFYISDLFPVVNYLAGGNLIYPLNVSQCWSLAIEEQFYIIFALFIPIVYSLIRGRKIVVILVVWTCCYLIFGLVPFILLKSGWFYKFPLFRFTQILLGVVIAFIFKEFKMTKLSFHLGKHSVLITLFGLLTLFFIYPSPTQNWFVNLTLFTLLCGLLIISSVSLEMNNHSVKILNYFSSFGKYSYGLYLYHVIFITPRFYPFLTDNIGNQLIIRILVLFGFSIISFHLVEQPIRLRINSLLN